MKLAANLSMLYGYLPLEERFAAAAKDGFNYVEILFPYDQSPQWYAQQLQRHQLQLVLINTAIEPPDFPVGMAAQPRAASQFRQSFETTLEVCAATGCKAVHVMPGLKDYGLSRQDQQLELIDNLLWAATRSGDVVLSLEALNDTDVPDYFYASPQQALSVLNACQRPNLGLQFDFYHVVKQGLDLNEQLQACLPWVRHVQVAGSPQRHEPVLEQHGLLAGFRQLHESGYSGFVGCEYRPAAQASDGLAWMQPLLELGWATLD